MANFNLVARLMKWIILVDVVLCVLLYLPDQVREFYRITVTTSLSGGVVLLGWMVVVGTAIWIASVQIAMEARDSSRATALFMISDGCRSCSALHPSSPRRWHSSNRYRKCRPRPEA